MREIKFRAWDGERIRPITLWGFYEGFIMTSKGSADEEEFKVMQFTGLYDSKKNPIYEGDIVKGIPRLYGWAITQKVHYLNGCFMFGNWNAHGYLNRHTGIEVVGNIYEDEDLVKSL